MTIFLQVPVTDLPGDVQGQMKAHTYRDRPNEACGFIVEFAPDVGGHMSAVQCRNVAKDPTHNYEVHPHDLKLVYAEADWRVVGLYHSHPNGPPQPSKTDLKFAPPDDLRYFIVTPGVVTEFQLKEGS